MFSPSPANWLYKLRPCWNWELSSVSPVTSTWPSREFTCIFLDKFIPVASAKCPFEWFSWSFCMTLTLTWSLVTFLFSIEFLQFHITSLRHQLSKYDLSFTFLMLHWPWAWLLWNWSRSTTVRTSRRFSWLHILMMLAEFFWYCSYIKSTLS